ncbi:protein kinase [bacterium]|nr:protein kinase [bacterium]MBP9809861.1 protein kinase [bacterium]
MRIEIDHQAQTVTFSSGGKIEHHYERGDIVGDSYQLIALIGQGGMGVVYRVQHLILDKPFALKLLAPNQINNQSWRRFETEGRALAKLNHPNIVSIANMGIDRGCPYFVMDWLNGMSLAERIAESGPLSERESLEIFLQVCSGLSCAHKTGIIHRDIKPANIMLTENTIGTEVKIVDFGIASLQSIESSSRQALTASGEVFGSPLYMSPEQTRGEQLDARSDLYSLGCSLFETLTGQVPFRGTSALATLIMHQEAEPPKLSSMLARKNFNSSIESSLDLLLARCLSKDIKQRYQSADQLAVDIQRIVDGKPIGSGSRIGEHQSADREDQITSPEAAHAEHPVSTNRMALKTILVAIPILALLSFTISQWLNKPGQHTKPAQQANPEHKQGEIERQNSAVKPSAAGLGQLKAALGEEGKTPIALTPEKLKALANSPPISREIKQVKGKRMRCFQFPTVVSIGEIEGVGQVRQEAKGEVKIPEELGVYLRLNSIINQCPELIDKIAVDDIDNLRLNDLKPASPVLERLARWTNLTKLTIDNDILSDADLTSLDKLKNLRSLEIRSFTFNWKPFTELKLLKHLNTLHLSKSEQLNPILQNLPPLPALQTLELSGQVDQWLTARSVAALAKQTNLRVLSLKTKQPAVDKVLPSSAVASDEQDNIKELPITDWVNAFSQLKSLERLEIAKPEASKESIQNFLHHVPAARSNHWAEQLGYSPSVR